jgi:hypothetical protein
MFGSGCTPYRDRSGLLRLRVLIEKYSFPLVGRMDHEGVPERTPEGAKRQRSTRSAAESCADGLSWHNQTGEEETIKCLGPEWNAVELRAESLFLHCG